MKRASRGERVSMLKAVSLSKGGGVLAKRASSSANASCAELLLDAVSYRVSLYKNK